MQKIILASASPRRKELMSLISSEVYCKPSGVKEEIPDGIAVSEIPLALAKAKAEQVAKQYPECIVVGCDTGVIAQGELLGKPKSKDEARQMMKLLSGKVHCVVTGCYIIYGSTEVGFSKSTEVEFYSLSDEEIELYVNTDEPYDKAGGYGIQGKASLFVKRINGDYFNVVGLPVAELNKRIKNLKK